MSDTESKVRDFAERMAYRAKQAKETVDRLRKSIAEAEGFLKTARENCPHLRTEHHARTCAEGDSWDECLDCGATIDE